MIDAKAVTLQILGGLVGLLTGLWISLGVFVQALLVLMLADVLTGLIAAAVAGNIRSGIAWKGLARKAAALILVLTTAWLSIHLGPWLGDGFPAAQAVASSFCLAELISLLENAKRTGLDLGPLERVLAVAKGAQQQPPPAPSRREVI